MQKIGILLINVGTPDEPTPEAVKSYLQEFLTDPWVIQAPWWVRSILFKRIIVPRRAPQSAKKYKKIWTKEGSPLLIHSQSFTRALKQKLGQNYEVELGMRYGNPSLSSAVKRLKDNNVTKIVVLPLFPQFADATTTSSVEEAKKYLTDIEFVVYPEFYSSKAFLEACAADITKSRTQWEHLLFSFHGLPVSHLKNTSRNYRSQCYETAELLAARLGLIKEQWSVSFQSRLGPVKWLEPYTDEHLKFLAGKGIQRLGVYAPSFVVDGLETLEEIAMEGKEVFLQAGGSELTYIPCLNSSALWIDLFAFELMSNIRHLE